MAGAIGNMLESYDSAAYGYFSAVIGSNFFPSADPTASLLCAFAVFAAAFFMRPIGGAVFGYVGDCYGRKAALVLSTGLMTVSTFAMGCLPTYETAGLLAPALLVLLRLGQGLSVGGENTSSAIYLTETAAHGRRGLTSSLACVGAIGGILAGSLLGAIVTSLLPFDDVRAWGWRLPFLVSVILGAAIFMLRRYMDERPLDGAPTRPLGRSPQPSPLRTAFSDDGPAMVRAFAMSVAVGGSFYVVFVYLPTYMHGVLGLAQGTALFINSTAMAVYMVCVPAMGALSDHVGRKPVLIATSAGLVLLSWPLFLLFARADAVSILTGQIAFAVLIAGYCTAIPVALVEMFKARSRCTALAISFNCSMALVGGTAPLAATWIVHGLHLPSGPGRYVALLSLVSLTAVLGMKDRSGTPLTLR
ncbi:MFS transporter [Methylobacterium sp. NEAU 140]|uniref:MFS transporter n=1 Tax=Methylobacterium sp. NEAU 140 TaxID=3064945 RepID=UPI0027368A9A|nr:MFS transporter [Methylobacterium sp. NEAU 140]MDP4026568.1 MFS transporter [Methylobacterium sp. NEAU 140]